MNAHPGKTAGSGKSGRKAASGLAGMSSAVAIVGAGIAALATGSTPQATSPEAQPQPLTATLTANTTGTGTQSSTTQSQSFADQPVAVQAGIMPAPVPPTFPVNPSVAQKGSVTSAGGLNVSFPFSADGIDTTSGPTVTPFGIFTPP